MKVTALALTVLLLLTNAVPAQADFKYTETARITGGAMVEMAKFAAAMTKTSEQASLKPASTTHYVKGNRLRIDRADGTVQIINMDTRQVIEIDPAKRTYGIVSFDEFKAALEQEQMFMQNAMQQDSKVLGDQASMAAKIQMLPAGGRRLVLGQQTTEAKFRFNVEMQSAGAGPIPTQIPLGPNDPNRMLLSMICDLWLAQGVNGYQEFKQLHDRIMRELSWAPSGGFWGAQMSQGMKELEKNASTLQGFPLLEFVSMGNPQLPGQDAPLVTATVGQNGPGAIPPRPGPGNSPPPSTNSNADPVPTTKTGLALKELGVLFGKKKQSGSPQEQNTPSGSPVNPLGNNTKSLVDMSVEVTAFSDSPLDSALFEIPAGYTQIRGNPEEILHPTVKH